MYPEGLPLHVGEGWTYVAFGRTIPDLPESYPGLLDITVLGRQELDSYVEGILKDYEGNCAVDQEFAVSGRRGRKVACRSVQGGMIDVLYLIRDDGLLFQLSYTRGDAQLDPVFEQMVETFNFVKELD